MKLFRRKITPEYIRKHYKLCTNIVRFETYKIGKIDYDCYFDTIFIVIKDERICLAIGNDECPTYWICIIKYIYQLRQMLKIYKIL